VTGRWWWREEVMGTRWGGFPAWERRREGLGGVWGAPGVVGVVFIGPGERRGGVGGVNTGVNGFNAIEDGGAGFKRGIKGGGNDGRMVTAWWHPRHGAGRRGRM
jgi:hypothetical protein